MCITPPNLQALPALSFFCIVLGFLTMFLCVVARKTELRKVGRTKSRPAPTSIALRRKGNEQAEIELDSDKGNRGDSVYTEHVK